MTYFTAGTVARDGFFVGGKGMRMEVVVGEDLAEIPVASLITAVILMSCLCSFSCLRNCTI